MAALNATEALIAGLREWAKYQAPHVRAAVELLAWHGYWIGGGDRSWLRHHPDEGMVSVNWRAAREYYDACGIGSTSERAVLDLAIALGQDRYRLGIMGHAHLRSIGNAFYAACGLAEAGGAFDAG